MHPFRLSDDLWLLDGAVFLPKEQTLVVSDLQLGSEGQLRDLGHNVRYAEEDAMRDLLEQLIDQTTAKRIVINGDLKHEFGRISEQERSAVLGLLSWLKVRVEVVVVRGNHDTIAAPLLSQLSLALHDSYVCGDVLCVHGHMLPSKQELQGASTIVIGHMHPAVQISDGIRSERCKCFLVGAYEKRRLVVLPSLARITQGADVLKSASNTPLLTPKMLEACEIYALADEILPFGSVRKLRSALNTS